jgi:PIN domain
VIIVFDTNVWISDLALTSSVGSAVRFYLREQKARIGLPEVIKLETEVNLRTMITEHIQDIQSRHRRLLYVFGRLKEVVLPTTDEVEALIGQVFSTLGVSIEEIPFTLDSAKASLIRTVKKLPPSDRSQQFKDGVLWEDCLKMLETEPVFLVSNDRAFYKGYNFDQGLATELKKDLEGKPNEFVIFPELGGLLSRIGTGFKIEPAVLIGAYQALQGEKMQDMAAKHSFALEGEPTAKMDVFVTETPSALYVNFTIELPCVDTTDEGRTGARIIARGEGTYDADAKKFVDLANRGEQLLYQLQDGTEKKVENVVLVAGTGVIGHRTVEHLVRHKLL